MLSGISVICFGASYAVALLLELSRLVSQFKWRSVLTTGFASGGCLAHTIYLALQLRQRAVEQLPWITWYTGCLMLAWVLGVAFLITHLASRHSTSGFLLLPTSLAMIVIAHLFPDSPRALQIWNTLHGLSLVFGMALVVIGFLAGSMYLVQAYRLKHKLPPVRRLRLPSLERLQKTNERCLLASIGLIGLGLSSGILLNLVRRGTDRVIPWSDPIVIASLVWLIWLLLVTCFHSFYRPARQGSKVAYMTIGSFAFLGLVLVIIWWTPTHGPDLPGGPPPQPDQVARGRA